MRAALRAMIPAGRGVIVTLASVGSFRGTPGLSAYCAAKAGVHLLTRSAAREAALETPGIRVVSVHPGLIDTPGSAATLRGSFPSADDPARAVLAAIPAGRMGTAAEAAALVAFLASDEASYLTGASFTIDGGMSA
jgi:NAD(P)-dependent dehydrogenase (short-subunit alcohol dehydrogenase family)